MGTAASVQEKAVFKTLKDITKMVGTPVRSGTLADLLRWGHRHNILATTDQAFSLTNWEKLIKDLWESYSSGNKQAGRLAQTWRACSSALQQLSAEHEVKVALQNSLDEGVNEQSSDEEEGKRYPPQYKEQTPHVYPAEAEKNFWGRGAVHIPLAPTDTEPITPTAPITPSDEDDNMDTTSSTLSTIMHQEPNTESSTATTASGLSQELKK